MPFFISKGDIEYCGLIDQQAEPRHFHTFSRYFGGFSDISLLFQAVHKQRQQLHNIFGISSVENCGYTERNYILV